MSLSDIVKTLLTSDEFYSLPVETRSVRDTYESNEYWQTVKETYKEIHDEYPHDKTIRAYGIFFERGILTLEEIKESSCKILLQIHDELIFEVHKDHIKKYSKVIRDEMSSVKDSDLHSFSIPLLVDVNAGNNWGDLH